MPGQAYNSIQNPRMYRALRRRGYSKEAAARISNARTPGHTVKATRITGNLFRGEGGRFQAGTGGDSTKPQATAPTEEPKVKPDRAAERDAALAKEEELRAAEDAAVDAEPNAKKRQALRRQHAINRRKRSAERRAQERASREADRAERTAAQDAKRQAAAQAKLDKPAKEEKPKKGGGGGGGAKPKPTDDEKRQATLEKRTQTARDTAAKVGLFDGAASLLATARDQGGVTDARLSAMGLIGPDGLATDQGRRAIGALERGDVGGFRAAVQDAQARLQREAAARARQAERNAPKPERDVSIDQPKPGQDTPVKGATPRSRRFQQLLVRRSRRRRAISRQPITKSFAVFKNARGQDCWACITTSAYEDRDTEIITRKGLQYLVATAKATGDLGTLNYWHTDLVLGDCTFQALSDDGIFLIEAGTFRNPQSAELGRRMTAKGWRMSPGFLRPASEPYRVIHKGRIIGLYDHPTIFERSPCPPGRASNLYTPFIAKETAVTDEQIRMLKSMAPDLADQLLAQVETQKAAAERANAVLKGDTAEALPLFELDNQYYTVKEGKLVSLKAFTAKPEMKAEMPPAEMIEAGTTEVDDGMEDAGLDVPDDGPLLSEADIQGIAAAVLAGIQPLFDIQKQIGELKSALGGAMGGTPATKAALTYSPTYGTPETHPTSEQLARIAEAATSGAQAGQAAKEVVTKAAEPSGLEAIMAQLKELQTTVKAIQGDQPIAATTRPTQADSTVVPAGDPLLNGYKSVADNPQALINTFLSGFPGFSGNGGFGQS